MIKKLSFISLIVILILALGYFGLTQYVKSSFSNKIIAPSNAACEISFNKISINSLSLPFKLGLKLKDPYISCKMGGDNVESSIYSMKLSSENLTFSFNLFDRHIKIDLPDLTLNQNSHITTCSGFDSMDFVFTDNIFSILRNESYTTSFEKLSYNHKEVKCISSNGNTSVSDASLDLAVDYTSDKVLNLLDFNFYFVDHTKSNGINADLLFTTSEDHGHTFDVKDISINFDDFIANLAGKLSISGGFNINGRFVLYIKNYHKIITGLENFGYDQNLLMDILQKSADYIDQDQVSIVVHSIGETLYIGKLSLPEFLNTISVLDSTVEYPPTSN